MTIRLTDTQIARLRTVISTPDGQGRIEDARSWYGRWKDWTEHKLQSEAAYCLSVVQQGVDNDLFQEFSKVLPSDMRRLGKVPSEDRSSVMEVWTRKYGVRFPEKKARQIAELFDHNLKQEVAEAAALCHGNGLETERAARERFRECHPSGAGFGLKVASHFLRNVGVARCLVPLDSRWVRMLNNIGLTQVNSKWLGNRRTYLVLEELVNNAAERLGVMPAELDSAVWGAMSSIQSRRRFHPGKLHR